MIIILLCHFVAEDCRVGSATTDALPAYQRILCRDGVFIRHPQHDSLGRHYLCLDERRGGIAALRASYQGGVVVVVPSGAWLLYLTMERYNGRRGERD